MIRGLDLLAGATYKKEVVGQSQDFAIGMFATTFGDAYPVAEACLKRGCKLIRIQLLWSDAHQFGDKDIPKIKKLAAKYNKLANKYPAADIRLSPFCEHNLGNPDKYLDIAQLAAPNCTIVNTPWKGAFSIKYINEIHGDHAKPSGRYHYSFDGTECTNEDVEAYKKKYGDAEVFLMWTSRFNLRYSEKDKTSRPQRIKESKQRKPSKDMIDSIAYLFTDKGETRVPKGSLLKSHAERHQAIDPKGDKMLYISNKKGKEIVLKTKSGKVLEKLPYYGPFENSGHRYYSRNFGFKIALQAQKMGEPRAIGVWIGKDLIAVVNPGFRDGYFR